MQTELFSFFSQRGSIEPGISNDGIKLIVLKENFSCLNC